VENQTISSIEKNLIEAQVIEALQTCFDPEIPVNIYEMGLIYEVKVEDSGAVSVKMTLTSPFCPAAQSLPSEVESKVRAVPGVTSAKIEIVWDPPWHPGMMSEAAKLQLGIE
jgi:FeS assembly SUF system protein